MKTREEIEDKIRILSNKIDNLYKGKLDNKDLILANRLIERRESLYWVIGERIEL